MEKKAEYVVFDYGFEPAGKETIELESSALDQFREELNRLKILEWDDHYEEAGELNGANWTVEIIFPDQKYKFTGRNAFPGEWDELCAQIRQLIGRDFW